jgi:hypothetical protein
MQTTECRWPVTSGPHTIPSTPNPAEGFEAIPEGRSAVASGINLRTVPDSPVMVKTGFLILKYVQKTPSLAACEACHLKFFVPMELANDPEGAEDYLRGRYANHKCASSPD